MGVEDDTDRLYRNKVILAPMVRAGTLPFRALALRYGADTVFTEEVIDRRVLKAVRTENPLLGTVDYVEDRGNKGTAIPFQTCPALERGRVVYQVGTGDAAHALRAAQHVERDVAAVDVNMGCPKKFSLQGAMGAALLKRPEIAADIVGTLRKNLSVPVSAKIRLLDTPSNTVEFAKRLEKAGACALTVHVRRVEDKPASKARWEELRAVVDAVNIPVIANGDVYTRADMAEIKALSGCSSVMLARPALLNCSIFKPDGAVLPLKEVIQQYLRECFRYDSVYQNAKYTVMEMLTKRRHPDHLKESIRLGLPAGAPGMREVTPAKNLQQLAKIWDVAADYDAELARRTARAEQLGDDLTSATEAAAERSCIHKFDDAYFLEPGAAESARKGDAPEDAPHPDVGGSHGRPGGTREDGDGTAKMTSMAAAAAVPELPSNGAKGWPSCGGSGEGIAGGEGAAATPEGKPCPQEDGDGDGDGDRDGGRLRGVETGGLATARAADGTVADGPSCGGSGEEIAGGEGAAATREGKSCPQEDGDGDGDRNGGRLRGVETGGRAAARAAGGTAAETETRSGESAEVGISGVEDHRGRDSGIGVVCRGNGFDERVGADGAGGTPGDGAEVVRPPAVWTSSKRPRKEEANAAAVL
eukprot:g9187.t1